MKQTIIYLNFDGNCREAMEFYKKCFEAELYLLPFSEAPADFLWVSAEAKDKVMHATLSKGTSTLLMASDTMPGMSFQPGNNFSVMIQCESLEEIKRLFAALGEKGKVTMALQDTFWAARFGTLTDRFGISWIIQLETS